VIKQSAGPFCDGKSTLDGIIFWLMRQEKAVVLGSCKPAIYVDL
jgi:hypothetical protein